MTPPDDVVPTSMAIALDQVAVAVEGRTLLSLPRLRIAHGERVAVVGPNGAGKSTLLRVLGGFAPLSEGCATVLGLSFRAPQAGDAPSPQALRALRARVGQVLQGLHLVPRLTARENVVLGALARPAAMPAWRAWARLYPPALRAEADAALAALGLAHRADTRADRLSGGERQKVGLARLALQRPALVLADEPTAALDPAATEAACVALLDAARGATLVTVVHDPALLPRLADRVIALAGGRLAFDLPVQAVDADRLAALYRPPPAADDRRPQADCRLRPSDPSPC